MTLLTRLPTWWPWALAVAVTSPFALAWWGLIVDGSVAFDWRIFVEAGERFWAGSPDLYENGDIYGYRHSPLLAMVMPAISWIGTLGIRVATAAAALAMPTWPMRILALASWPFAMDLQHGALITLYVCVAAWAMTGSRLAGLAFIQLALLSPRALMLPVAIYLLWREPSLRLPAAVLTAVNVMAVLATGYADAWIGILSGISLDQIHTPLNLSPSRFLLEGWIPIGLVLAALLTWRGKPGLAALAANPYVLPHYLLFALLDVPRARRAESGRPLKPSNEMGSQGGNAMERRVERAGQGPEPSGQRGKERDRPEVGVPPGKELAQAPRRQRMDGSVPRTGIAQVVPDEPSAWCQHAPGFGGGGDLERASREG